MNRIQIKKALVNSGIDINHISIGTNKMEIMIRDCNRPGKADYELTEELKEKVQKIIKWGGFQTGYGSWILSKNYTFNELTFYNIY